MVRFRGKTYVLTNAGDHFGESTLVNSPLDPHLPIDAWPTLSQQILQQQQIMRLVG